MKKKTGYLLLNRLARTERIEVLANIHRTYIIHMYTTCFVGSCKGDIFYCVTVRAIWTNVRLFPGRRSLIVEPTAIQIY